MKDKCRDIPQEIQRLHQNSSIIASEATSSSAHIDHFFRFFSLRVDDDHVLQRLIWTVSRGSFDPHDQVHALEDFAEDGVLAIQPRGENSGNEELGPVGVLAGICHRQEACFGVLQDKVFVVKLAAVDGEGAAAIAVGDVSSLDQEVLDDPVEQAALVAFAFVALLRWKSGKVLNSFRSYCAKESNDDAASRLSTDGNIPGYSMSDSHWISLRCWEAE